MIWRKKITSEEDENFLEVQQVYKQIDRLRDKMKAQTILTQKLASDRAESTGQTKEAILSEERHRIARELHDSVSQQLFAAMMLLSALNEQSEKSATPAMQKQLKMVESIVNESQSEMRALLLHLRPTQLEGKSLKTGIEQLLKELTTKLPIEVEWQIEDISLQKGIEDHLFRIVQELLSNTLRHSKAKLLEVRLVTMDNLAVMKVVDDGVGFDMDNVRQGSYGLQNMRERVAEFGGTIKIISFPGRGTSVEIKIPLVAKKGRGKRMIKVLLVDDHEMVRIGVSAYLSVQDDMEVVGEAENGREGADMALELRPDIILMDLVMDEMDGIEATKEIMQNWKEAKIIIVTSFIDDEKVYPALEAGASSYMLKTSTASEIADAIRATYGGDSVLEPEVTGKMMQRLTS